MKPSTPYGTDDSPEPRSTPSAPPTTTRPKKARDGKRIAAWSLVALVGMLGVAGVVYEPKRNIAVMFEDAEFFVQLGLLDAARVELEAVLERDPDHQEARLYLASIQQNAGEHEEALRNFLASRAVLEAHGDSALIDDFYVTTGILRLCGGDLEGAASDAEQLISSSDRPAAGFLIRALISVLQSDDTSFRQDLARAFALDPSDPLFRLDRRVVAQAMPWTNALPKTDRTGLFPLR